MGHVDPIEKSKSGCTVKENLIDIDNIETEAHEKSSVISLYSSGSSEHSSEEFVNFDPKYTTRKDAFIDVALANHEMDIACKEVGFIRKKTSGTENAMEMDSQALDAF
mmetsp:Transcript_39981/g.55574  ORF Transcript_39981/g.55574 Transcript_39981/m.55574 type:complete len:108 (+) Transcript_39981:121-444(+)|eukprot:CAMPEP_0196576880 /NCGR_PEP_ID=MMETSP1081-20130531/6048_1 /TAXON_ID=36882 /ORGANISM="Pyramimonas amylifera, Strain CCMP720" /LENGTH=107 /DNA_ID=CAMNT_0041895611 /DNA_START=121 /DNA_END=444 /DNA_ORIENTATION=-